MIYPVDSAIQRLNNWSLSYIVWKLFSRLFQQPVMNGHADEGDWSESSDEGHQGRYSPLVAMTMSGTNTKPPTGFSPPRSQSPLIRGSTPMNTTGGALGTSLNVSFGLQGKKDVAN